MTDGWNNYATRNNKGNNFEDKAELYTWVMGNNKGNDKNIRITIEPADTKLFCTMVIKYYAILSPDNYLQSQHTGTRQAPGQSRHMSSTHSHTHTSHMTSPTTTSLKLV